MDPGSDRPVRAEAGGGRTHAHRPAEPGDSGDRSGALAGRRAVSGTVRGPGLRSRLAAVGAQVPGRGGRRHVARRAAGIPALPQRARPPPDGRSLPQRPA